MAEIVLVRHGQANSHATDAESYDRLSELGQQQARWLGEHLSGSATDFDRVITGTLTRQIETARLMGFDNCIRDARLDELPYFELVKALADEHDVQEPNDSADFMHYLPRMFSMWSEDRLTGAPRRFDEFASGVIALIDEQCGSSERVLLVTSGGVIGMAVRHALGLDITGTAKVMLHITNSSMHTLRYVHDTLLLGGFNATPHLDIDERMHARTYI
ncbi:MAG: histidine phosphatase family protein [Pseudomonadota bacterium]